MNNPLCSLPFLQYNYQSHFYQIYSGHNPYLILTFTQSICIGNVITQYFNSTLIRLNCRPRHLITTSDRIMGQSTTLFQSVHHLSFNYLCAEYLSTLFKGQLQNVLFDPQTNFDSLNTHTSTMNCKIMCQIKTFYGLPTQPRHHLPERLRNEINLKGNKMPIQRRSLVCSSPPFLDNLVVVVENFPTFYNSKMYDHRRLFR